MTTFGNFWKNLLPRDKDILRTLLAEALYITTTTVSKYGRGERIIPLAKQPIVLKIVKEKFNVNLDFSVHQSNHTQI